jgi:site-specific recombinase XerD
MPVSDLAKVRTTLPAEIEASALASLAQHAAAARGAYAANTERALRADVAIFTAWCSEAGHAALPASAETIAGFIDAMAAPKAPATVRRYVSSVATFHRAAGVANPCATLVVKLALKRMHRERGRAQAQAAPVNDVLVARMLAASGDTLRHRRNRALLAVAYSTLCRRSELVALRHEDLQIDADGFGTITLRRSKTDQEGVGEVAPIAADALRHLSAWIEGAGLTDGPLFRAVLKGGRVGDALDSGDVARIFKAMAQAARLTVEEIARISGHSTRVGAAQDMVRYGVDLVGAMQAGRWKTSAMVARYSARLLAKRGGMAQIADRRVPF